MSMEKVGSWSFIIGLVIALIFGLMPSLSGGSWISILVILGVIVGFLNVTGKEVHGFLVASIAVMLAGGSSNIMSAVPLVGSFLEKILNNFVIFVAPAAIIVAVKELLTLARD